MADWNALVGAEGLGRLGLFSTPLPHPLPPATPLLTGVVVPVSGLCAHIHLLQCGGNIQANRWWFRAWATVMTSLPPAS